MKIARPERLSAHCTQPFCTTWCSICQMMESFLTWCGSVLARPDLPAWLQAFAAIVALGLSAWAGWRVGDVEKHRDRMQARAIAVAIYPELLKLPTSLDMALNQLAEIKKNAGKAVGQSVAMHIQYAQLEIPPMLERNIDRLYLLGEPGGPACLQLVSLMLQFNELVQAIAARTATLNADQWAEGIVQLDAHLALLADVVKKCAHEVRPLHDAARG